MHPLHPIRPCALLLFPILCAAIASATPPDPRLLSLVPRDSLLVAGITSSRENLFVLMTRDSEVDLRDFLALSGVDSTRAVRQVVLAATPNGVAHEEHSLLAAGHFDQARIFAAALQNGAAQNAYRGIALLELQPFSRERAAFSDVRWMAILDAGVALLGTIPSVREELDRHLDGGSVDPALAARLARLHRDDASWCVVDHFVRNPAVVRALGLLDETLAGQVEEGDAFQFGIHFGRRVRFEYEFTRAGGPPPAGSILAAFARSLMGEAMPESSLLPAADTAGDSQSERGAVEVSVERYETWLQEVSTRAHARP